MKLTKRTKLGNILYVWRSKNSKKKATDKPKRKTSSEIVDFTYFHDFIVHLFFFLRICSRSDITNENEERSWSLLKKWISNIKQTYAHKYVNVKEFCYNNRNVSINHALDSIFPFFTDIGDNLFIPKEFVYDNNQGEFKEYFLFFLWHLADLNPDIITVNQELTGLNVYAPLLKKINQPSPGLIKFTPDTNQTLFFNKILEHLKSNFSENSFLHKALATTSTDPFFWRKTIDAPWFKSPETIQQMRTKKRLIGFLKVCKEKNFVVEIDSSKDLQSLRNKVKKVVENNKHLFDQHFPN